MTTLKEQEKHIPLRDFAKLAGVTSRAARWAVAQSSKGATWRGARLQARRVAGRGGAGGAQYEVLVSSLPLPLQAKWHELRRPVDLPVDAAQQIAELREARSASAPTARAHEERAVRHAAFYRLPGSRQNKAKRRLQVVQLCQSLTRAGATSAERYEIAARESNVSTDTVRRWERLCRGLDPGDWLIALAPKYRGCQARAEYTPEAYLWGRQEYFQLNKPTAKAVHRRLLRVAQEKGWTAPPYITFKRLLKDEPHYLHVLLREGEEAAQALRPYQQRDYSALKLHEIWVCDGRRADVFCRWPDGSVSRPIVITWLDVRSRVVLSYRIARSENADDIRLAFKDAAEKFHAIPETTLLDNSREFASKMLSGGLGNRFRFAVREEDPVGIFRLMGIEVIWTLPYSGRSKPIESFHRHYAEAEKRCGQAYCGNRPDAKPEDFDPAKAIPIKDYRALLNETLSIYHATPHRGDSMHNKSPREVYEVLLPDCRPRRPTKEQLRLCLMAAERIKLDRESGAFWLGKNRYWSERLAELPRDREYLVRSDPGDFTQPVSIFDRETFICEVPIVERTGFRDQAAAKTHQRARRQHLKALKLQAAARVDMNRARTWVAPPPQDDAATAAEAMPAHKVVELMRPERDYRPKQKKLPSPSTDEVLDLLLTFKPRQANEG